MKPSDQEYHVKNMKHFIKSGRFLMKIPNFPNNGEFFYKRDDESGWWMPIKQSIIGSYINLYLQILQRKEFIDTCFIDPLSNYGMIRLTKNGGNDVLIIPGTSLNAALISLKKIKGFSEFYINEIKPEIRCVIRRRFEVLNQKRSNLLNFNIEPEEKGKVDSNEWIIDILNDIKKKYEYPNYLAIIDNQGMDIGYETIKEIQKSHEFGDLVITFHDSAFSRSIHNQVKNRFFYGTKIDEKSTIEQRRNFYIRQLKAIGFGRIEEVFIRSDSNFFYTLLFCCRENVSAKWLDMIKYFRKTRFRNCTAQFIKNIYDIAKKNVKPLNKF